MRLALLGLAAGLSVSATVMLALPKEPCGSGCLAGSEAHAPGATGALRDQTGDIDQLPRVTDRPGPAYLRWKLLSLPPLPKPGLDEVFSLPWRRMLEEGASRITTGAAVDLGPSLPPALGDADVVLFCDDHACRGLRRTFCDLVLSATTGEERADGRVVALFEALPGEVGGEVDAGCGRWEVAGALRSTLLRSWAWPITEYLTIVPVLCAAKVRVHGVGTAEFPTEPPPEETPDSRRSARPCARPGDLARAWAATNARAVEAILGWYGRSETPRRRCFVLIGGGHTAGGEGFLRETLVGKGLSVVVVNVLDRSWELLLLDRHGEGYFSRWYEVLPGILRAPLPDIEAAVAGFEERFGIPAPFRFLEAREARRAERSR